MNFMFWNTARNPTINSYLELLIQSKDCDIVALAEYEDDTFELLERLGQHGLVFYPIPTICCERIDLFVKFTPNFVETLFETNYYTIQKLLHPSLGFLAVAFVHFPSPLHTTERERSYAAIRFREDLEATESRFQIDRTIVAGDFNLNPFEPAMLSADAFHSVPSREIASQETRIVQNRRRTMFYNPMWNFFGDKEHPPGTYYYRDSGYECVFWNMFDQVIVRPHLIPHLDLTEIQILTEAGGQSLLDHNGLPNKSTISDHLPLFFSIR